MLKFDFDHTAVITTHENVALLPAHYRPDAIDIDVIVTADPDTNEIWLVFKAYKAGFRTRYWFELLDTCTNGDLTGMLAYYASCQYFKEYSRFEKKIMADFK